MTDINKWFYSLTLNELHEYIVKLEVENEKLVKEFDESNKMCRILENIAKSTQTGYSLLRRVEINKNCECNEHLNIDLRKALNESISQTNQLLKNFQMYHSYRQLGSVADSLDEPLMFRQRSNTTISDTTATTSHHYQQLQHQQMFGDHPSTRQSMGDLVMDLSDSSRSTHSPPVPLRKRYSMDDKDSSASSTSPHSSGYESNDYTADRFQPQIADLFFHRNFTSTAGNTMTTTTTAGSAMTTTPTTTNTAMNPKDIKLESQSPITASTTTTTITSEAQLIIDEDMPQNLSKPKSPSFGANHHQQSVLPLPVVMTPHPPMTTHSSIPLDGTKRFRSLTMPTSGPMPRSSGMATAAAGLSIPKQLQHLPNKCTECDLSFNLKPSLDQHLLTHVSPTFTVQRAGRGRPAKNDSRILRVTDSDLNILRMNDAFGKLPEGLISLSALEELRRHKFTGFGRYRCPWPDCGYTPHFLRDLRRHMFKHTGDKKYKCDVPGCDFITVWKTSLLQHQRKKHNLMPDPHTIGATNSITSPNTTATNGPAVAPLVSAQTAPIHIKHS